MQNVTKRDQICGFDKRKTLVDVFYEDFFVPHNEFFSNRFLEDLEKIWELRYYIPDPNKLEYANCDCAPCSRYKGEILQGW